MPESDTRPQGRQQTSPDGRSSEIRNWSKKAVRRRVLNFTPSWFSVCMGTGITSILLRQLPYQFPHLDVLADVIFVLNVFLFFMFLFISIARYSIWPTVWTAMLYHPQQSLFLGTFPMGFATIVNMVVFTCVPAFGPRFITIAWVLWWIDAAVSLMISIGMPFVVFSRHQTDFDQISGIWFLPIVAPVVAASTGGIVASVLEPARAHITIVASYILWGAGVPIAFILMPLYYARLAIHKLPPSAIIVSVFLPLGPCGQGAFTIVQLAKVFRQLSMHQNLNANISESYASLSYSSQEIQIFASAIYGCSIVFALVLWGVGLFWLTNALLTILDMAKQKKIPFNMGWWGFTFPLGTFASATTALGAALSSNFFRVLGTVFSVCVALLWLFVAAKTAYKAWEGSIFYAPCLDNGEPPVRPPHRPNSQLPE